ncbi:MAG: D-tyrosyl-tRNA(Tyr) deacylase [Clostridiales bacterium]|nr:D-tyrosyl-tRNA(Tyr) deacylase [Clostridiales bacterium]
MKAVVQRVKETSLRVDGKLISQIPFGLIVYFGVKRGDTFENADYLAGKIAKLRVFEDENGKMNKSVLDVQGEIMSVSQFTLYGDVSHGNRPSFIEAEVPDIAEKIYDYFCEKLETYGVSVKRGIFGADMKISQLSDGPVTIIYDI